MLDKINRPEGDAEMNGLRVWLLGGLRVEWVGQPVTAFESDKARAMFCYLLLEARPIRREQLAGLFWGEQPEARARGNLSRVLSNLRDLLPDQILSDRATIALAARSPVWVDSITLMEAYDAARLSPTAHKALEAALKYYRGPLLAGFSLPGCPEFEEWLRIQQERVHLLALSAFESQSNYHRERGEWSSAVSCARQALELEPWRESAHRQLMLLLSLQGEREQALHQYELCRRILKQELDVEPATATKALYRRLLDANETPIETLFSPAGIPGIHTLLPFVGRENDHAWLLGRWEAARRGANGLTLLAGEAGIGKTRLIQEALRLVAAQGAVILSGRCYEFNRALPYQAIHEALKSIPEQATLAVANPLTQRQQPEGIAPAERSALFEAIVAHLNALCTRQASGVILCLDDLHWADADTLDLLHYLARTRNRFPFWLIGTYRPSETPVEHPLKRLAQSLDHDWLLYTRALAPLSAADITCLTTQLLGTTSDTVLAPYLFRESEGNPFLMVELVETLREQDILRIDDANWELTGDPNLKPALPARLQDVILQRIQRLDELNQYLLLLAAAYGGPFDQALLAQAGECASETIEEALREWQTRQLVHPVSNGWDLAHDTIRSALYQTVPAPLRRLLHARLAYALEAMHPEEVTLLAHHFDQARQEMTAAHYLLLAGDQARQTYAHEQALSHYRRGLELAKTPALRYALLTGLESVCDLASQREEQRAVLEELAELVRNGPAELSTPQHQIEIALRQAHLAEATSDFVAAAAAAERAVALAQTAGDSILSASGLRHWAYALRRQELLPDARTLYEHAKTTAERIGAKAVLSDSLQGLANIAWNEGDFTTARVYLERSLALCRELGDRRGEADAYNILGIVAQREGNLQAAREHTAHSLELRRAIGDRRAQGLSHNNLGAIALALGELDAAETAYTIAGRLCYEANDRWGEAIANLGFAEIALARGNLELAQSHARQGWMTLEEIGAKERATHAQRLLARIQEAAALYPPSPPDLKS